MNYSLTYASAITTAIVAIATIFKVEADSQQVEAFVSALLVVVTTLATLYGRWRKGDLHWFGSRKDGE